MSDAYLWETYDRLGREALDRRDLNQASEAFRSAVAVAEEIGSHDRLVLSLRNLAATMVDQALIGDSHELLNQTLDIAKSKLGDSHSQTIETQRDLSQVCKELGYLDKADGLLKTVLEYESLHGTPAQLSDTLESLAKLAQARDNPQLAAEYFERIVEIRTQAGGDESPEVAQALLWLSTALHQSGQAEAASAPLAVAFGILEKQFADAPEKLAQSLLAGAQLMVESGQFEPALEHQKRALDILSNHLEPTDPKLWETREFIATSLASLGKIEESIELLEYCLRNQTDAPQHRLGALNKNLGGLYLTLGKQDKAEELYQTASDLLEASLGAEHPAFLATQEERIQLFHFTGQSKKALDIALKCIRATESRFGPGHPNTAQTYASTALLAHSAREWETALELMRAAEKIWGTLRPVPEDVLANCRANIATCLVEMKRFDEAEVSLTLAEETAGPSLRPVLANLRQQLATQDTISEANIVDDKESQPTPSEETAAPEENKDTESVEPKDDEPLAIEDDPFALPDIEELVAGDIVVDKAQDSPESEELDLDLSLDEEPLPESPIETVTEISEAAADDSEQTEELEATGELAAVAEVVADEEESPSAPELVPEDTAESLEQEPQAETPDELETTPESESLEQEPTLETEPASESLEQELVAELESEESSPEESEESLTEPSAEPDSLVAQTTDEETAESAPEDVETESLDQLEEESPAAEMLAGAETEEEAAAESSEPEPFVERRSAPRNPVSLNKFFDLRVAHPEVEDENVKSFLVDIGPGGLRINSEQPFPATGDLVLTLPAEVLGEETDLRAQVVWQKPLYGASFLQGIEFQDLTAVQKHLLNQRLDGDNGRANSRQHYRLYRPFPIKLLPPGQEEWLTSYATDLSLDGIGTRLKQPLEPDNELRLRLELEFELPTVEVEAKVAWSSEGENGVSHGLQFAAVGPVEAKTIKRYIDRCLEFSPD